MPTRLHHIRIISSPISKAVTNFNAGTFLHPVLSDTEHVEGYKLVIDYWADTCCDRKYTFVEAFIEGKTVTDTGFISSLGSVSNINICKCCLRL